MQCSYHRLPEDTTQPEINEEDLRDLAAIFVRHGVQDILGIHLVHGHPIPDGTVLLGHNNTQPPCRWACAVHDVDLHNVHGHVFTLTPTGFHPYELQEGPPPPRLPPRCDSFLSDLAGFLLERRLDSVLGLETLVPIYTNDMFEVTGPAATIMVEASNLTGCIKSRQTAWKFTDRNGPRVCQDGKVWHVGTKDGHKNTTDAMNLISIQDAWASLVRSGLLK